MGTLTIRISDDKQERLKALAKKWGMSVNKLIDELETIALAEQDARTWFEICAKRGDLKRGLATLDMLDEQCTPSLACAQMAAYFMGKGQDSLRSPHRSRRFLSGLCVAARRQAAMTGFER